MKRNTESTRTGFTLIELLAVILILAILLGLMTQAAQKVIGIARERRLRTTCRVLETALARYRDEYGIWPIPRTPNTPDGDYNFAYGTNYVFTVGGNTNKHWFTLLRATDNNADETTGFNPKRIRFVDESTIYTLDSEGRRTPLHKARQASPDTPYPFVGVNRQGKTVYYRIEIDVDKDTVVVDYR